MPFTAPVVKIVFGGALPASEQWQCGLWLEADDVVPTQANLQAIVDGVAPIVRTFMGSTGVVAITAGGEIFNRVAAYYYPAAAGAASLVANATVTQLPASGSATMPNQCSLVVTLLTIDPSRKGRGRFYLPCMKGLASGSQMDPTTTQSVATGAAAMISSINALSTVGVVLGGTSGFSVTSVRVDTIVDTQRRRSNKIVAAARSAAVVA